jgi:hypothetical protein
MTQSLRQMHASGRVLYRVFTQRVQIAARKIANGGIAHSRITWGLQKSNPLIL